MDWVRRYIAVVILYKYNHNMKILFLNWKDEWSPDAGGAEVVHTQIINRLVRDGHEVVLLTQQYKNKDGKISEKEELKNGCKIIRIGTNKYIHTFLASFYYLKKLRNQFDVVVSCNNTAPYFAGFLKGGEKHFSFYHQLAREVWWLETKFPLNYVGFYLLEPVATFLQSITNPKCITISESSKKDLIKFGFKAKKFFIISEGIDVEPVKNLEQIEKYSEPTMLSFGAMREMKRTLDIVKTFEIAKDKIENLKLKIAGSTSGEYAKKVLKYIENSRYKNDIEVLGKVSQEKKIELMQKSHVICVTSIKEGWGLIVTEANSQGTPACVYGVDGLRDSTKNGITGLVSPNGNTSKLAENVVKLLQDKNLYKTLQQNAWQWSKEITFDKSYKDFCKIVFEK
jgi:glycosyltransferase involved in cell wall biosynthesis